MVLMRSRMRREWVSCEYECDWIWVFKCHLVNSCVRLYEFDDELEMTLSLWGSLRMYSGIVLQFLLYCATSVKIVCEWAWVFTHWHVSEVSYSMRCALSVYVCFVSFKTVSQVFVQKFFSVVIGQRPTSLRVFVFEVFGVSSCVVSSDC